MLNLSECLTGDSYNVALSKMHNLLNSKYISNLMLEASSLEEREALSKRITSVILTVECSDDGRYVVTHTDGVLDTFDYEPLWSFNRGELIESCKRWYGNTCILLFIDGAMKEIK